MSVRPSVRPSVLIGAALIVRISVTIDIGTFVKIDGENPNLDKIWKISGTLHEDLSRFCFLRRHKIAVRARSSTEAVSAVRIAVEVDIENYIRTAGNQNKVSLVS
jgi:hypothetical protein